MVSDVIATSRENIAQSGVQTAQDIRDLGAPTVLFSKELWRDLKVIRIFLFTRMYRAPSVVEMRARVTSVVEELFPLFMQQTDLLPSEWRADVERAQNETELARIVADYISGMTDRFAQQEHDRLIG
jgi:dGTPase